MPALLDNREVPSQPFVAIQVTGFREIYCLACLFICGLIAFVLKCKIDFW